MKNNKLAILLRGIITENPVLILILGTCPTLALTTMAMNGVYMGIAVTFVLICSNLFISLLRNIVPEKVRIPAFVLIIATFVTIVDLLMQAYLPDLSKSMGVFIPLIVVNCIILGRAESFASHNPVGESALVGLFMGIGFTVAITLMGIVRELLGNASFFGIELWDKNVFSIGFFTTSAGAFLTYGLFIAGFTAIYNAIERKAQAKLANA